MDYAGSRFREVQSAQLGRANLETYQLGDRSVPISQVNDVSHTLAMPPMFKWYSFDNA
jgi:hypothetical protein